MGYVQFDRATDVHPEKEAFVDLYSRFTYGEAREKTDKLALSLMDLGIKPKDRVLLQLPERMEFIDSMPLTAAEKIDKKVLRTDIEERLAVERK